MNHALAAIAAFDPACEYAPLREEILAAVDEVLSSGRLILGPQVEAFESAFAEHLGVVGHGVGVASGTDALAAALLAMEIGPGDEVITATNSAVPTATAIQMTGATPVFCDVDPRSLLIDLNQLESLVGERTKAIVPVHLFGGAVDMDALMELAHRRGLAVVEDCAQACGTTWRGRHVGTFGDVGCFSFYPTKNLGACGDGGLCFTRHPWLADALRQIRGYGCDATRRAVRRGLNSRLDEFQAAILRVKLAHLPDWVARRRQVARWYDAALAPELLRPASAPPARPSYHLYVIATRRRELVRERLTAHDIGSGVHYPEPLHTMPAFQAAGRPVLRLPVAERLAGEVLSLPCYPQLSREAVETVAAVVNDALNDDD